MQSFASFLSAGNGQACKGLPTSCEERVLGRRRYDFPTDELVRHPNRILNNDKLAWAVTTWFWCPPTNTTWLEHPHSCILFKKRLQADVTYLEAV